MLRTCHLGFIIALLCTFTAAGATVKKISKKHSILLIDVGTKQGLKKKDRVCVLTENNKKAACGFIVKVKENASIVKVKEKRLRFIKKGYRVIAKALVANRSKKMRDLRDKQKDMKFMALRLNSHYQPISPAKFNNIGYAIPSSSSSSAWSTDTVNSSVGFFAGFGGELEIYPWNIITGIRYTSYDNSSILSDYDTNNLDLFMETDITANAFGFYADYLFFDWAGFSIGGGLDLDYSSVSLVATRKDGSASLSDEVFYTLDSSLAVLSLRLPIRYTYKFGSFGASVGITSMIPFYAPISTEDPGIPTETSNSPASQSGIDERSDLSSSLNHTKSTVAFDLSFGVHWSF